MPEEIQLDQFGQDRPEGQRRQNRAVAQFGGRVFPEIGRVVVLDGLRELTELFAPHNEGIRVAPDHSADICLERHELCQSCGRDRPAEDLLAAGGGRQRNGHGLGLGICGLHPAAEDELGALAVVGHRHHGGEPHVVLGDRAGVADPRGDVAAADTHGQHAVCDRGVQAEGLGDLIVPVDRVQVAGNARVIHQVLSGQRVGLLGKLVTHLHGAELTQWHQ